MDDSNLNQTPPNPTEDTLPEAMPSISNTPSSQSSFSSDRESLSSIHETLSAFEREMKAVLTPENYERRFREKRRNMYSKYIQQELGSALTSDSLRQTLSAHPDLLTEASKNDVFRAILLEDTMGKVGELESDPIKSAEKKLAVVRDIYDAAEKVDPEQGGVTPEWAVRKRREIRGALAREIVADEKNLREVESYISSFEQYEVNRVSAEDDWKEGDVELARHFRQVMREKERGELAVSEDEEPTLATTQPVREEMLSTEPEPAVAAPEPSYYVPKPEPVISSVPEVESPAQSVSSESLVASQVERKKPEEIALASMSGATRRVRNINPGPVGTFFTGVLEGRVSSNPQVPRPESDDTSNFNIPSESVKVEETLESQTPVAASEPVKEENTEETIEQTLRAAIDQIRRDQEEGVEAPEVIDHSGRPIQTAAGDVGEAPSTPTSGEQQPPVEKKKGFFGKLFGR